jgi:Putative phage metallopeptidase
MAIRFDDADQDVYGVLDSVLEEHFGHIACLEPTPTFDIRMAYNEKPGRAALKKYGHPVGATIEIIKPKERAAGGRDIRITIDGLRWGKRGTKEREGLIFHELMHLKAKLCKKTKDLIIDPYGRPMFGTIPDGIMFTGFKETVDVYGEDAPEYKSFEVVKGMFAQQVLPFVRDAGSSGSDSGGEQATQGDGGGAADKPKRRKVAN